MATKVVVRLLYIASPSPEKLESKTPPPAALLVAVDELTKPPVRLS